MTFLIVDHHENDHHHGDIDLHAVETAIKQIVGDEAKVNCTSVNSNKVKVDVFVNNFSDAKIAELKQKISKIENVESVFVYDNKSV